MGCCSVKLKYAILDSCFSERKQQGRGMAAEYVAWELRRRGLVEYTCREADCLLVTCTAATDTDYLRTIKRRYPDKLLVAGGAASTSPYSLGQYADMVCVGDGQRFMNVLLSGDINTACELDNVWIHGEQRPVAVDQGFPWHMPPIRGEDGAIRLWCGRGCRNKCAFCQVGWAYEYSEHPEPDQLVAQAHVLHAHDKIAYLSNDVAQHSFYRQLPPTEHGSYSVRFLAQNGLPPARQIRLGIEGVSERLRKLVNKPISRRDLIGCTRWLVENGKSVRWFLIAGLPTETKDDWLELRDAVQEFKCTTTKGVLELSFTAWCPDPATPLAPMPLRDDYWQWFSEFKEWFFGGRGWSNRVKILSPQQPENRLRKAMASMGLAESQLRAGGHWGPNDRVQYPYKRAAKAAYDKVSQAVR
jgi:hypothetical protein